MGVLILQVEQSPDYPNCLAACVASILEVNFHQVPMPIGRNFTVPSGFFTYVKRIQKMVLDQKGLEMIWVCREEQDWTPKGYAIMSGLVPGREGTAIPRHSVVTYNGKIVWDPAPGQPCLHHLKLNPPFGWWVFIARDPAKQVMKIPPRRERRNRKADHNRPPWRKTHRQKYLLKG